MEKVLEYAHSIEDEIIYNRRKIHENPEIGFELNDTIKFVREKLSSYGIESEIVGKAGITCTIGNGSPVIMLRADMDALPMKEESNLKFSSKKECSHTCGHDIHTAMLLGAAKILKNFENDLNGTVKFMFQPAEELLAGAKDMVNCGILENPHVDSVFALHSVAGISNAKSGYVYHSKKELTFSGDSLIINIIGEDAHGSTPYLGIDSIYIAAEIVMALKTLPQQVVPIDIPAVVLTGEIKGGTAVNTVAGRTSLHVSVRCKSVEYRKKLLEEIEKISKRIGNAYGADVEFIHEYGMPPLYNDEELDNKISSYIGELIGDEKVVEIDTFSGAEDLAMISEKIPTSFMLLGLGSTDEGYEYFLHNPKILFNESEIYKGAAIYSYVAMRWLFDNQ